MNFGEVTTSLSLSLLIYEVEPMLQKFSTGAIHTKDIALHRGRGVGVLKVSGLYPSSQLGQGRAQAEDPRKGECAGVHLLPLLPDPTHPRPQGQLTLAMFRPGVSRGLDRVGFVSRSRSETQAILNSSRAKGTDPEGQTALWDWG